MENKIKKKTKIVKKNKKIGKLVHVKWQINAAVKPTKHKVKPKLKAIKLPSRNAITPAPNLEVYLQNLENKVRACEASINALRYRLDRMDKNDQEEENKHSKF